MHLSETFRKMQSLSFAKIPSHMRLAMTTTHSRAYHRFACSQTKSSNMPAPLNSILVIPNPGEKRRVSCHRQHGDNEMMSSLRNKNDDHPADRHGFIVVRSINVDDERMDAEGWTRKLERLDCQKAISLARLPYNLACTGRLSRLGRNSMNSISSMRFSPFFTRGCSNKVSQ